MINKPHHLPIATSPAKRPYVAQGIPKQVRNDVIPKCRPAEFISASPAKPPNIVLLFKADLDVTIFENFVGSRCLSMPGLYQVFPIQLNEN